MIRARVKRVVRSIFAFRCGYCGVSETEYGSELTYDHFRPRIQNGDDTAANLVYACYACNTFKADYWSDADDMRFLHPLNDNITLHIAEQNDGIVEALTPLGEIYRSRLQLNRPALVAHRLERQRTREVERHLAQIDLTLNDVLAEIKKLQ